MKETYKNRYGKEYTFTLQDNGTVLWEGDFKFSRLSFDGMRITMVDPSGGPYIAKGMPGTMAHPQAEGTISHFTENNGSYTIHLKVK